MIVQRITVPIRDNLKVKNEEMNNIKANRIKTEILESCNLVKEGYTLKDKLTIVRYIMSAGIRFFKKIRNIDYERNYAKPVTLKNEDGIFFCDKSFSVSRILSYAYESDIKEHFQIEGGVFVDVGAHAGKYTVRMAKKIKDRGEVIALEPENFNFALLTKNIELNGLENVTCIKKACSDEDGIAELYRHNKYSTLHSIKINKGGELQKVETCKLDSVLAALKIENVELIKMDVEGAELEAIKGAAETLQRYGPSIIFEAWDEQYFSKIREILVKYKYQLTTIKGGCYLARKA